MRTILTLTAFAAGLYIGARWLHLHSEPECGKCHDLWEQGYERGAKDATCEWGDWR